MTVTEIVNIFAERCDKHYVLQKQVISNKTIKALKEFRWILWEIKPKKEIFIISITSNSEEKAEKELSKELLNKLLTLYESSKT